MSVRTFHITLDMSGTIPGPGGGSRQTGGRGESQPLGLEKRVFKRDSTDTMTVVLKRKSFEFSSLLRILGQIESPWRASWVLKGDIVLFLRNKGNPLTL